MQSLKQPENGKGGNFYFGLTTDPLISWPSGHLFLAKLIRKKGAEIRQTTKMQRLLKNFFKNLTETDAQNRLFICKLKQCGGCNINLKKLESHLKDKPNCGAFSKQHFPCAERGRGIIVP